MNKQKSSNAERNDTAEPLLRQAAVQIIRAGLGQPIAEGRSGAHAIGPEGHGTGDGVGGAVGEGQVHGGDPPHRIPGVRHRVVGGIGLGQDAVAGVIGGRRGGKRDAGVGEGFREDIAPGVVGRGGRAAGVGGAAQAPHAEGTARAGVVGVGDIIGCAGVIHLGQAAEGIIREGGSDAPGVGTAQDVAGTVVGEGQGAAVGTHFLEEVAQVVVGRGGGGAIRGRHPGEAVMEKSNISELFDFPISHKNSIYLHFSLLPSHIL